MRRIIIGVILTLACVTQVRAQQSHGYVFAGPGSISGQTSVQVGGGFEALLYRRLVGFGAEAGYLTVTRDWGGGVGFVSPNFYVHAPLDRFSNVDPYFTLGYSLLFRSGTQSAFNYGGGLNWWFHPNIGLKIEVRDQTFRGAHWWGLRFGFNFR